MVSEQQIERLESIKFHHFFSNETVAEIHALIDLARKLPSTADGVRVVPGMKVYWKSAAPYTATDGVKIATLQLFDDGSWCAGTDEEPYLVPTDFPLYSTPESLASALAAREGVGDAE